MARILDLVGDTPSAELNNLNKKPGAKIFAKLEGENPECEAFGAKVKLNAAANNMEEALDYSHAKLAKVGYYIIEANDLQAAIEIGKECPTFKDGDLVEVRPLGA